MRPHRLLFLSLLLAAAAQAVPYRNPALGVSFELPAGWKVRPDSQGGIRVLPPLAEDRERSGVAVRLWRERLQGREPMARLADGYRKPQGNREAAGKAELQRKTGRLVLEYREGEYVLNGLWILRSHLRVVQQDGRSALYADCAANASEFHRYRKAFAALCLGASVARGKGA
ncbi:hypothetical protein [Vogesella sp. LIG4]|uniref:hypothetical protein n=1 Tax=Vogesella sp. LIG4 TaxID=1192162 RepID=UPI00081F9296|nr:hypothetical protein [Vogesella sp. LIG4]SCK28879.1 hypothetical protein PSELUDRAFT_3540 [Vogesella sp. LIG4]